MFNYTDTLFERLAEYLSEKIAGDLDLEAWFDRTVETTPENSFGLSPDSFPQVITSRSLNNAGGGHLVNKRTIREVKIDAVKAILEELTAPEQETVVATSDQMARFKRLRSLSSDLINSIAARSLLSFTSIYRWVVLRCLCLANT
jgi:hypothetical protein